MVSFSFIGHLGTVQETGRGSFHPVCVAVSLGDSWILLALQEVQLHQLMIFTLSWYCRLLRTSPRPLLEGPSSGNITSVWSLPHTYPLPNHGLYLCLPVFPVRPILWECLVGCPGVHPTHSSANGEDDKIQDFPSISALLPPDLQLHSLQSPLGQS